MKTDGTLSLRIGPGYAKGLRKQSAEALVASREQDGAFRSAEDLALRVPSLNRKELTLLARIGALESVSMESSIGAMLSGRSSGPANRKVRCSGRRSDWLCEDTESLPLRQMNTEERLVADYAGTGLTVGKHPMHYRRRELASAGNLVRRRICEIAGMENLCGRPDASSHGNGQARPRASSLFRWKMKTGIANVIVTPDLYERDRLVVTRSKFLLVEGPLQNQDGVIHVKASRLLALSHSGLDLRSHDFH